VERLWTEISRQNAVIRNSQIAAHSTPQWTPSLPLTSTLAGRGNCNSEFDDGDVESFAKSESAVDTLRAGQTPRRANVPGRTAGNEMLRSIHESPRASSKVASRQSLAKAPSPSKALFKKRSDQAELPQWTPSLPLTSTLAGRGNCNSEFDDGDVESFAKSESAVDTLRAGQTPRRNSLPGSTIHESPRTANRLVGLQQSPAKPQSPSKARAVQKYDMLFSPGGAKVPPLDLLKSESEGCIRKGGHWPVAGSITPRSSLMVVESPRSSRPGVTVISQPQSPAKTSHLPQSQLQSPEVRSPKARPPSRPKPDSACNAGYIGSRVAQQQEVIFEHGSTLESVQKREELARSRDSDGVQADRRVMSPSQVVLRGWESSRGA
jgi:hypothetical protein